MKVIGAVKTVGSSVMLQPLHITISSHIETKECFGFRGMVSHGDA